ncbi:MAG: hypothetical protein ACE1Z7_01760 [Woeseiaceae bacterium]
MAKVRATTLLALGCALAGSFFTGSLFAETLQMEGTDQSAFEGSGRPIRGMTQDRVQATHGTPQSRQAAVGDPPISRWEYPKFVVYFEYDRVIHAVLKR